MAQEENLDFGQELMSWEIPEYDKHERTTGWYIMAGLICLGLMIYGFYTANYLFVIIIFLFVGLNVINYFRQPDLLEFIITTEGIIIGTNFYDFDDIKDFSVIYKPSRNVRTLYLNFKSILRPRLSIPLADVNPVDVREHLIKYLAEDLERTDEANSDYIAKKLKL